MIRREEDNSEAEINQGTTEGINRSFERHRKLCAEIGQRLSSPRIQEAISKLTTIGEYMSSLSEPTRFEDVRAELELLARLQAEQYANVREFVGQVIGRFAETRGVEAKTLVAAYWGSGNDKFAVGLPGWWHYISNETGRGYYPEDWPRGSEGEIWVQGKPKVIIYDVQNDLPTSIPGQSLDVSLFKTIGWVPLTYAGGKFWERIEEATKPGGLVITTDAPPAGLGLEPLSELVAVTGSHVLTLNAPPARATIDDGYVPRAFEFYTFPRD